jgi:two-component system sensor histidine kinase AlgZ
MHPIFRQPGRLAIYFGGALTVGLLLTAMLARQGLGWIEALALIVPASVIYGFVCLSAFYVCLAAPLRTSSVSRVLATASLAAATASALWLVLARAWYAVLDAVSIGAFDSTHYGQQVPFLFTAGVLLFLLSLAVHYALVAIDDAREAERRQLQAEVSAREAQLRALRAQLDPHFLYNSLNSINALTTTDPGGARRMCIMLGDFLRQTMAVGSRSSISLADELALADQFLGIEQVRFGSRLRVERSADESAAACQVPPLVLQPLVENAVTHGIARMLEGGIIKLEVARSNGIVSIAIENPRDVDRLPSRSGVGLQNVRQRIAAIFGDAGRLDIRADSDRYRAVLTLPCRIDD